MLPRGGRVYRYPPGRGLPDVPMPGVAGGMFSVPYDMGGMPLRDASLSSQPVPVGALASALANATPDQQRTVSIFYIINGRFQYYPYEFEHESLLNWIACDYKYIDAGGESLPACGTIGARQRSQGNWNAS